MADVDAIISLLHIGNEKFQLIDQGSIDKYLGLMIRNIDSNSSEMSQPFLICLILEFLSLYEHKTKGRNTPVGKPLLNCDLDGVHTLQASLALSWCCWYVELSRK